MENLATILMSASQVDVIDTLSALTFLDLSVAGVPLVIKAMGSSVHPQAPRKHSVSATGTMRGAAHCPEDRGLSNTTSHSAMLMATISRYNVTKLNKPVGVSMQMVMKLQEPGLWEEFDPLALTQSLLQLWLGPHRDQMSFRCPQARIFSLRKMGK